MNILKPVSWIENHTKLKIPDKIYLKIMYKRRMKQKLNLKNPQTFNEKLQWLKLNDRNPNYTQMVDKYEAKKYVGNIIGEEHIIPTIGVWDKFEEINFDELPNQFVLKCTHDSGTLIICKDKSKFDIENARIKLSKCLKVNYYYASREWPYKDVKPRIIAEEYMGDETGELTDYKFMCFNGKVKCSFVCTERQSKNGLKVTFFDLDWNRFPFERHYHASKKTIERPMNYDKMIQLAEKLAKEIPFVRVDWYEINGQVYFGELTFFPGSGFEEFNPEEWDFTLGKWIELPNVKCRENYEK